jgi:hypothetical protein
MALENYETVAQRLQKFWAAHPEGRIETQLAQAGENFWVFRAAIYATRADTVPIATGHAHEVIGASNINRTSALEVCETSAVGRALALAGWAGQQIASAEEVGRAQKRATERKPSAPSPAPARNVIDFDAAVWRKKILAAGSSPELMAIGKEIAQLEMDDETRSTLRTFWRGRQEALDVKAAREKAKREAPSDYPGGDAS